MNKNSEMHSGWKTLQSKRDMRNHKADTAYKHYYRKNSLDMSKKASKPGEYVDYIGDEIDAVTKNNPWKNESKNMNKKLIRLTESDLHKIVKESVNRILREGFADDNHEGFPYMVVTYNGEEEVDRQYVTLPRQGLRAYDDEVPFTLGSNQALIELD